jgi:hypothetical protein
MKLNFRLDRVENIHEITVESDPDFLKLVQHGILLSLRQVDQITDTQLRQAEEYLLHQHESN